MSNSKPRKPGKKQDRKRAKGISIPLDFEKAVEGLVSVPMHKGHKK
jgi:hypothetical protein